MRNPRFTLYLRVVVYAAILLVASSRAARADMGIPMLMFVWPGSWVLLLPIIALESWVATRMLKVRWGEAFRLAGLSNLLSTLLGIPVTWGICLLLEFAVGGMLSVVSAGHPHLFDNAFFNSSFSEVIFTASWLIPSAEGTPYWVIPADCLVLCVPFYFMSVWTEGALVRRLVKGEQKTDAMRWAWRANTVSYGLIVLFLLGMTIWYAIKGPKHL